MELLDYLRIARRRLWFLLLVPVLAAVAAAAYVVQAPQMYSATASLSTTAFVGGSFSQFTGTQAASQFAAAFTASATGPSVLSRVSQETQVSTQEISTGLTVSQNGASSDMTLTYSSSHQENIVPVLNSVTSATLNSLFAPQVQLADAQVKQSQADVVAANKALQAARKRYGPADPVTLYQVENSRVAVSTLTTAQTTYQAAQTQLTAAQAADILYVSDIHTVSRTQALIRTILPVVAAAIFLAVILVFMLEMIANARRRSKQEAAAARTDTTERIGATDRPRLGGARGSTLARE